VAALELAVVVPVLLLLFIIVIDYGRAYFYSMTIETCARNGALYACDSITSAQSPYTSVTQAALADAGSLTPPPTVTSTNGTDASGNAYVEVTVSWDFQPITRYPGLPSPLTLTRTVRMRVAPITPQ
jgi:Flp pilus assembly protein TadG